MNHFSTTVNVKQLTLTTEIPSVYSVYGASVYGENSVISAIRVTNKGSVPILNGYGYFRKSDVYRWYNNKLFLPVRLSNFVSLGGKRDRLAKIKDMYYPESQSIHSVSDLMEAQKQLDEWAKSWLIIDGILYGEVGEPRYVIMTFGLGMNHGIGWGTCLCVDHGYNSNIPHDRYFAVSHEEDAIQKGLEIAKARGDTKAYPHFTKRMYPRFEIYMPDAIRLNPTKEHGNGDPFLNKIEMVIQKAKDPIAAGLIGILMASSPE